MASEEKMSPAAIATMRPAGARAIPALTRTAHRLKVSREISSVNKRIMGAAAVFVAALLPAVWSGSQTAAIFALEALLCLTLIGLRTRAHRRLWNAWEIESQAVLRCATAVIESD